MCVKQIIVDVKRVIKNLGVDAANDYISKNYRAVAEAFVKDKNIISFKLLIEITIINKL